MRSILVVGLMFTATLTVTLTATLAAQVASPAGFAVQSATSTSVVLSWQGVTGASSYVVQRRAVSDAVYLTGGSTVNGVTFTDSSIDPYTAYAYRIFGVSGSTAGFASGEVFVGPPPSGFSYAVVTPTRVSTTAGASISEYGQSISIALDANGDPAMAFKDNSTGHASDSQPTDVYFVGWNRAAYRWNAPVKVDTIHSSITPFPELALAYDASTKLFGVAYESYNDNVLWFSTSSDGGATWNKQQAFVPSSSNTLGAGVSLKMGAGKVYLLVSETSKGIWYITGAETAASSTWTKQISPTSGSLVGYKAVYDLALDSNGAPGVVFSFQQSTGNWLAQFWRPPATSATAVTTSNSVAGNDTTDAKIAFTGTNPRVLVQMARDSQAQNNLHLLWLVASSDGGATWGTPVPLPNDGDRTLIAPTTLAANAQGEVSVSADDNGGTLTGVKCGWPKLMRSKDLATWTACNPGNSPAPDFDDQYPAAIYGGNGKLMLAFQNYKGEFLNPLVRDLPFTGVMLWRESPQPSGLAVPSVPDNGIVGNAGEVPGKAVSPGQIIEIYGVNMAAAAPVLAGNLPLPTVLGTTTAVTTSVFINRIPAPIFYLSAGQIDVQVPFETPYNLSTPFTMEVMVNDTLAVAAPIKVLPASPGMYVVTNVAGAFNNAAAPAHPGDFVIAYMTGLGLVDNPPATGAPALATPLSHVIGTVTATIGGKDAPVSFAGLTPGNVGLYQVTIQVPTLASGSYPIVVSVFHSPSNTTNSSQSVSFTVVSP